ncbi:MAG: PilZ domain-containing protein [Pseudomonadales bacterium]|nr:PilZ domain-containing protein [Pseudomonadales bacterium]
MPKTDTKKGIEKRRYPRTPSQALLEVHHPALGVLHLRAINASIGGFFAAKGAYELPPVDTVVEVFIKRHSGTVHQQPARMRVAHISVKGMGLEFV